MDSLSSSSGLDDEEEGGFDFDDNDDDDFDDLDDSSVCLGCVGFALALLLALRETDMPELAHTPTPTVE